MKNEVCKSVCVAVSVPPSVLPASGGLSDKQCLVYVFVWDTVLRALSRTILSSRPPSFLPLSIPTSQLSLFHKLGIVQLAL